MKNKLLISVFIPCVDVSFDIMIPNNCKIGYIKKVMYDILKSNSFDMSRINFLNLRLINRFSGLEYDLNIFVNDSTITNGAKLILI